MNEGPVSAPVERGGFFSRLTPPQWVGLIGLGCVALCGIVGTCLFVALIAMQSLGVQ